MPRALYPTYINMYLVFSAARRVSGTVISILQIKKLRLKEKGQRLSMEASVDKGHSLIPVSSESGI